VSESVQVPKICFQDVLEIDERSVAQNAALVVVWKIAPSTKVALNHPP
jgi:hypothetical protein